MTMIPNLKGIMYRIHELLKINCTSPPSILSTIYIECFVIFGIDIVFHTKKILRFDFLYIEGYCELRGISSQSILLIL